MSIPACYFDGQTSRRHAVQLSITSSGVHIEGEANRAAPLNTISVSQRARHAPRKLSFTDGAYVEVHDNAALHQMLAGAGYHEPLVVGMERSWRAVLVATSLTLAFLVVGYLYALPRLAEVIAFALPEDVERKIGAETLSFLDQRLFKPSELPEVQREAIRLRFENLTRSFMSDVTRNPHAPQGKVPHYSLVFRKSRIGPNAFALPSGEIVLTDEIVKLVQDKNADNDAVMAILAHELGHLHERHMMRRVIQSSAMGVLATVLLGDVSALAVNVPTVLLDMKYSRDAEREADDYAIALLQANGVPLSKMVLVFEKLEQAQKEKHQDATGETARTDEAASEPSPYLSSHPSTAERIARIRQLSEAQGRSDSSNGNHVE